MLWFGAGYFVYKCTNQCSKSTDGNFHLKSPNVPDPMNFFYLWITVERYSVQSSSTLFMVNSHRRTLLITLNRSNQSW